MNDLTVGKEGKVILYFALPLLVGNIFQQLYQIVDSAIVGHYIGKEALGAVGASFPVIFSLISLIIGLAIGSTIIIAQYFGAKKIDDVKRAISTMFIVLFFASILVTYIGITFSERIFRLIKLPEEIIPEATKYFNIYIGGSIFLFGFNGTNAILRGLGDSKTPLVFIAISNIINIALDLLFVVKFKMGIEGVAYGTLIAYGLTFFAGILYLNKHHAVISFRFSELIFDYKIFKKSIYIGLPTGLQQMFVAVGMSALFRIVNQFGTNVVAAYSVAGRIDAFAILPAMNFAAALSTFVGQNIGAKKTERVKKGLRATLFMSALISVMISLIASLFGQNLMKIFTNDADVIQIGAEYLVIVSSFYLIFSSMFVLNGVFRGAGDTIVPMFITLLALWFVRIPISIYLSKQMGESGIWWGVPIAWSFGILLSTLYYFTGRWKRKVIVDS